MTNGTDQLLGKLIERTDRMARDVHEIKNALNMHAERIEARVMKLEMAAAEATGGTRMIVMFGGIAATIGGIIATLITKIWPS